MGTCRESKLGNYNLSEGAKVTGSEVVTCSGLDTVCRGRQHWGSWWHNIPPPEAPARCHNPRKTTQKGVCQVGGGVCLGGVAHGSLISCTESLRHLMVLQKPADPLRHPCKEKLVVVLKNCGFHSSVDLNPKVSLQRLKLN